MVQPSASTNSKLISHTECRPVCAQAQGRQREEQADPPQKKRGKKGNKQTAQTKKRGGQERKHSRKAAHPLHKRQTNPPSEATPKVTPTGPPERTPEDHPAKPGNTQPRAAAHRRKGHPGHAGTHRTGEVAGRKNKKIGRSPNERGRGDGDQETQERDRQRRPPQFQDTTGPKTTHPPAARKEKKTKRERRGQTPPTATPAHPHARGSPTRRWRETDAAHARGHTLQHPSQKKAECRQNSNQHTHTTSPSQAECDQNPCSDTHTLDPNQEWRGYR